MADQQHPSGITLDLFDREGLRSLVQAGCEELSRATTDDEERRACEAVIGRLTLLAHLGRAELDRQRSENQGPINQDEIEALLTEFDIAVQEWRLVQPSLSVKPRNESSTRQGSPPVRPRVSDVDILRLGPTLTKHAVSEISGYSISWVEKMTAANRIPGLRRAVNGRHVVYDASVILQWYRDGFPLLPAR